MKFITSLINRIEGIKITPAQWFISFFAVSFTRNYLEGAFELWRTIGVSSKAEESFKEMFILFSLEWLVLFLFLVIIFRLFTGTSAERLFKITLMFFAVIIIVPLIDYAVYYPEGSRIFYINTLNGYAKNLLFFFYFPVDTGVSAGVRAEVLLAFTASFIYVRTKCGGVIKPLAAALLVYFFAVSSMCFPVFSLLPILLFHSGNADIFIKSFYHLEFLGLGFTEKISVMILFILAAVSLIVFLLWNRKKFMSFFSRSLTSGFPFACAAAALLGMKLSLSAGMPESGYFNGRPFAPFFFSGAIMAVFAASLYRNALAEKGAAGRILPLAVFFFPLLSGFSISYAAGLTMLLALLLMYASSRPPFSVPLSTVFSEYASQGVLIFIFLFFGFTCLYGSDAPSGMRFSTVLLFLFLFIMASASAKPFVKNNKSGPQGIIHRFLLITSYILPGIIFADTALTSAGFLAGAASAVLPGRLSKAHLSGFAANMCLSVFLIMAALIL